MNYGLTSREQGEVKLNCEGDEIFEKIILPSYLELFEDIRKVPGLNKIVDKIKYDIEAKALDVVYGVRADTITIEFVSRYLSAANCVYEYGGCIFNGIEKIIFPTLAVESFMAINSGFGDSNM